MFDYQAKTVEFYTTKRSVFLALIGRNPGFINAKDLDPGYVVLYPLDQVRHPRLMIRQTIGGEDALQRFLTPREVENRQVRRESAKQRFNRG